MKLKVLVVDDESDVSNMLSMRLEASGYETSVAQTGEEALRKVEDFDPDIMVLDVMMPGMDGFEVCQKLRQDESNNKLSIIFLSARGEDWDLLQGYFQGGDSYLAKPVEFDLLLGEIEKISGRKKV